MTFYIVKCFSVDELEWKFLHEYQRDELEFSHGNKNVKNVGEFSAYIKLKNKDIKNDRQYNITIKNEIKDDDYLEIGVCNCEWEKLIDYTHRYGNINDNNNEIKKVKEKFKCNDSIVIKDTCVAKLNNNKYVYFVSMFKNGDEIFRSYYSDKNRKQLYLYINDKIEVEVNVKGKILNKN